MQKMKRITLACQVTVTVALAGSFLLPGCGSAGSDEVTLIFRVTSSECRCDAHIGAHPYYGGTQVPGLPIEQGDPDVTYVYSGKCPSEGIYINAEEIGGTSFTTDYYFNCRSDPYVVEVYFTGSYCSERVIE